MSNANKIYVVVTPSNKLVSGPRRHTAAFSTKRGAERHGMTGDIVVGLDVNASADRTEIF